MFRTSSGLTVVVAVFFGCATPGYRVNVQAGRIMPDDRQILTNVENKAKASPGFVAVFEGKKSNSFPGSVSSSYVKHLSERWRDQIVIRIFYLAERERLIIDVECGLRGAEPPVKAEIDALGDMFVEELSSRVGREKVLVERGPWSIPVLTDG